MPVLRIYAPAFSFEQKKIMATELTEALWQALPLPEDVRKSTTIHFIPYLLENMAVGGRLLSETEEPQYQLEFHCFALSQQQKENLIQQLMPLLLELLGLGAADAYRLLILFQDHAPCSFYSGEQFLNAQIADRNHTQPERYPSHKSTTPHTSGV